MKRPKLIFTGNRESHVPGYMHARIDVRLLDGIFQDHMYTLTWQSSNSNGAEGCAELWYAFAAGIPSGSHKAHFDIRISELRKFFRKWDIALQARTPAAAIDVLKGMNCQEAVYDPRYSKFVLRDHVENPTWHAWGLRRSDNVLHKKVIASSRAHAMSLLWALADKESDTVLAQIMADARLERLDVPLPNMTTVFDILHGGTKKWTLYDQVVDPYGCEIEEDAIS